MENNFPRNGNEVGCVASFVTEEIMFKDRSKNDAWVFGDEGFQRI